MITHHKHDWDVSPKEAIAIQEKLRQEVILRPLQKAVKTIAGVDVSLNMFQKEIYAGVIVLTYPDLEVVEYSVIKSETSFPYISGLLSFREIPALMECISKLSCPPDVYMVDGQGIAHPRRFGIASHLGVLINAPTIGCAKSRLFGNYEEPLLVGESKLIFDPKTGDVLGNVLKSKARAKPLIISPGTFITAEESLDITRNVLRGYRLPEPTRQAHNLVNKFRRGESLKI